MVTTKRTRRTQHTTRRPILDSASGGGSVIREMIGREARPSAGGRMVKSVDATIANYAFWDKFRRCAAKGYEISGTFARPITQILASWVMGEGALRIALETPADDADPLAERITYTNGLLADFVSRTGSDLLGMIEDLYALGDQYLIVNADGTISIPSPETVTMERDAVDYRTVLAYTVTTELEAATITDRYTATERTVTIKIKQGNRTETQVYDNLIGVIPVVHWANDRGTNETHGRPIYEGLLRIFSRYDDLIEKMLDGAELMGNPIPTLEGMKDPMETVALNGSKTDDDYTDDTGDTFPRYRIRFDALSTMLVGEGGAFKFVSPPTGFTGDIRSSLKSLFMLIMEFTRIPEAFWGNELSSARATASEQLKTFYKFIAGRRLAFQGSNADSPERGGLLRLADVWLRFKALADAQVLIDVPLRAEWAALSQQDAQIVREWAALLHDKSTITDATLVGLSGLVDNPAEEVERARQEAEAERDLFEVNMDAMLNQPDDAPDGADDSEDAA